ncbi:hypothetical protein [Skermania pinensis]|uniref:hypothetical protein n=1 Tax=Skermania pinensis TaxID=39122 RepID=UPI0014701272|nr:hypothetical protein [Skermania piniformis]
MSSGSAVTVAGVYRSAIRLSDGRVLAPAGPPDVVVLAAARRGAATVQLTTGDPFHGLPPRELVVVVA